MKKQALPKPVHGTAVVWSPVNQAYVITWHSKVLRVISDRSEAIAVFRAITGKGH